MGVELRFSHGEKIKWSSLDGSMEMRNLERFGKEKVETGGHFSVDSKNKSKIICSGTT